MIQVKNISISLGEAQVLQDVSFDFSMTDKVGLVGVNGAGKTTLLKIMKGELEPDTGTIQIPRRIRMGYVPQTFETESFDSRSTALAIIAAGRPLEELERRMEAAYLAVSRGSQMAWRELDDLQAEYEIWGGVSAHTELLKLSAGIGLTEKLLTKPFSQISGGEKSKVLFARTLFSLPDILLLDEPTNHLDATSRLYVMDYLRGFPNMVVCVSHDGDFLDGFVNKIACLDGTTHRLAIWPSDYSGFLRLQAEDDRSRHRLFDKQSKEEARLGEFVSRMQGVSGKRKRQAKSREKVLAKLAKQKVAIDPKARSLKLRFDTTTKGSRIAIDLERISFAYPRSRPLFAEYSLRIQRGERWAVIGQNGAGKSTLLKLMAGRLEPLRGSIVYGSGVVIGYYTQEYEGLDHEATVMEEAGKDCGLKPHQLRHVLASFLFSGQRVFQKVYTLSPGERSRLSLAKLVLRKCSVLLLDEPTNHLDPNTCAIVGAALKAYGGTIVVVSHTPDFLVALGVEHKVHLSC